MAVLTTQNRAEIWSEFQRQNKDAFGTLDKLDILAAVDALDTHLNTNKAAIIASISEPAASGLSGLQKARLLAAIMQKRFVEGA